MTLSSAKDGRKPFLLVRATSRALQVFHKCQGTLFVLPCLLMIIGPRAMRSKAEQFWDNARRCAEHAQHARDLDAKRSYLQSEKHWVYLAQETERMASNNVHFTWVLEQP